MSFSKRYHGRPFLYWWDVWDGRKTAVAEAGELILVQKDTRRRARIPADVLLKHLTEQRRTSRGRNKGGKGNWGLYVRPGRPTHIELSGGSAKPAMIEVVWE